MGIFGVHMPLLYGEGENAFYRLQQEIIKSSSDHSIFARGLNQPLAAGWWAERNSCSHDTPYPFSGAATSNCPAPSAAAFGATSSSIKPTSAWKWPCC